MILQVRRLFIPHETNAGWPLPFVLWAGWSHLLFQGFGDSDGVHGGDPQQGTGWALRRSASLLPVLERGDTDTDHEGEFRLGLAQSLSDRPDIVGREFRDSARLHLTAPNGSGLADTSDVKGFIQDAPELVVEVSKATRYIDLGPKLADYELAQCNKTAGIRAGRSILPFHSPPRREAVTRFSETLQCAGGQEASRSSEAPYPGG